MNLYRNSSSGEGNTDMFRIFTSDESTEFTTIMLDPHTTSPGHEPTIVRTVQNQDGDHRESEI